MTDMTDRDELELWLSDARIEPRHDREHREALRAELRARLRDRRTSRPLVLAAVAVVTLGATFIDQPALESTGVRLDAASIVDDGSATFSTRDGASPSFSFGRSNSSIRACELDSLRLRIEQMRLAYLEGRRDLTGATGLTFGGVTAYSLEYGEDDDGFYYPVDVGAFPDSDSYHRFVASPRYREIWYQVYQGELDAASTDTLLLDGNAVAMTSWRLTEPEFGTVVVHLGTPLN
jgi:hypothetical protein